MTCEDVIEVLAALDAGGIDYWVDGGWGIDALVGELAAHEAPGERADEHEREDLARAARLVGPPKDRPPARMMARAILLSARTGS